MKKLAVVTVLLILTILSLCLAADAAVLRVKWDSPNDGPGNDWEHAYHSVTAGLNTAVSGDQVWVAQGTYVERITLKDGIALYGGFSGTETTLAGRNWKGNITILDGNRQGSVVTTADCVTAESRIDGFTIRNGHAEKGGGVYGGLYNRHGTSFDTILANCTVTDNEATTNGGGIHCSVGTSYWWLASSITASNCIIRNNTATGSGGGVYCETNASALIQNSIICKNTAEVNGGGLFLQSGSSGDAYNNTIADNTAGSLGGGIYCGNMVGATLANNIVAFNAPDEQYDFGGLEGPIMFNNCYYHPGVPHPVPDWDPYVVGNINVDPIFIDRGAEDYHISPASPCVDKGKNGAGYDTLTDIDGQMRVLNSIVDIGADEITVNTSSLKLKANDDTVSFDGFVITAVINPALTRADIYVESDDRTSGLKVYASKTGMTPGMRVKGTGQMKTGGSGERYLYASEPLTQCPAPNGTGSIDPLGMTNSALGGGNFFYTQGYTVGQQGITGATSLNNIGLLVRIWGKVTEIEQVTPPAVPKWFKIDDGSGIGVKVTVQSGMSVPSDDSNVSITGISSCEKDATTGSILRLLKARTQDDIKSY